MYYRLLIIGLLSAMSHFVMAEGLYLQEINNTVVTQAQLAKAKEKLSAHKELELQEALKVAPFHQRGELKASLEYSSCTGCHLSPPHTKSERTRTFMNMHSQFIACETCHFHPKDKTLTYQWEDVRDGAKVKGKTKLFRQVESLEEHPRERVRALHAFYKITPFYQKESVVLRKQATFTQETEAVWQQGAAEDKIARRALIHAPLEEKGLECAACHDKEQKFLDLDVLGANSYQSEKIYNNMVAQFFARYKEEDSRIRIMSILK